MKLPRERKRLNRWSKQLTLTLKFFLFKLFNDNQFVINLMNQIFDRTVRYMI